MELSWQDTAELQPGYTGCDGILIYELFILY